MKLQTLDQRISDCRSEINQFERWRDERLTDAAELVLDIAAETQRLEDLCAMRYKVAREENKAARRKV